MHAVLRLLSIGSVGCACAFVSRGATALTFYDIDHFVVPTSVTMLLYSSTANALVLKNTASAIVAIDIESRNATTRLANSQFTDMTLSPSGRYVFGADYGGENIGYGTPLSTSYVHRLDLTSMTWDLRTAYIAGNVQAVSDTQVILKSIDQWVTFTNNAWGIGTALIPLNTPSGPFWGPSYYASVYFGDFRYDPPTGRLLHGNSNESSQEVQAFRIVNNEFVKQEGSGIYGSAQGYGGSVVRATDGSAFYYGALQVDPLDVTHNLHVFPELIRAANGGVAFGDGKYYDAHTGALLGSLPFSTTVYAMNPSGDDFWAFDPATTTVHHFGLAPPAIGLGVYKPLDPCRIMDTRNATAGSGVQGPIGGGSLKHLPGFITTGLNWSQYGQTGTPSDCGLTNPPGTSIKAIAMVVTLLNPNFDAFLGVGDVNNLAATLSTVALNYTHGQGLSTMYIVPQIASNSIYFALPPGLSAHIIFDVVGYFVDSDATALQCTTQTSAPTMVSGGESVGSATSPACDAGYTLTSGSCDNDAFANATVMNLVSDKASSDNTTWFCSAINHGSFPAHLAATANCCQVPGR